MNPNEPQFTPAQPTYTEPIAPQQSVAESQAPVTHARKRTLVWGLILLIAPTVLIATSYVLYAIASSMTPTPSPDSLFGTPPLAARILNATGLAISAIGVIAWLPGLVIGIVLLSKRKK